MIGNIKKPAFTLLEVIVSVAIFAVIVLAASQIFQSVISSQVKSFTETALQDDVRYFVEIFTREARGAMKNTTGSSICGGNIPNGTTYVFAGNALYFQNKLSQCVAYYPSVDSDGINRLVISRDGTPFYVTSNKVDVDSFEFVVADSATVQPLVTMNLTVKSKTNPNLPALNIQTSVSSGWHLE